MNSSSLKSAAVADHRQSDSPSRRAPRLRTRGPCRRPTGHRLSLELLEDRRVPSVSPLPIPGGVGVPNRLGGPDIHVNVVGPADSTVMTPLPKGGEPSSITDFIGSIGVARVNGTGTDGSGNPLLWDVDMRFMQGAYQGVDGNLHFGTFAFI